MQIADDPCVADPEDGGRLVRVDRDDDLRALHAHAVGQRAGDAACQIQLWTDLLAGLPHLSCVGVPAAVDERKRHHDGTPESVGQLVQQSERLAVAESAPTCDDDVCRRDLRSVGSGQGLLRGHPDRASLR